MSRQTPQSGYDSFAWADDTWYDVKLKECPIEAKGTPGYQGKLRRHSTVAITWVLVPPTAPEEEDVWVRDYVALTVRPQNDGTPANCKLLICALSGRDPRAEATPWVDDETLEWGFGAAENDPPAGRIVTGIRARVKGDVKENEKGHYLKIRRYALPVVAATAPVPASGPQLSPDGRWQWSGTAWVPVATPPPAAPVQTEML